MFSDYPIFQPVTSFHSKGTAPYLLVRELSRIHPDPDPEIIKLMLTN